MKPEVFRAEACSIGDTLVNSAKTHRGRTNWLSRVVPYNTIGENVDAFPELTPMNQSVYSGTAGIALFLARLSKFSDEEKHRSTAISAMRHAVSQAHLVHKGGLGQLGSDWRFGFYLGTLGIAWAANEVGLTVGEPSLERDARRIMRRLAPTAHQPMENDVMFGPAGGIPALLDLDQHGIEGSFDLAEQLGDTLVRQAHVEPGTPGKSWGNQAATGKRNMTGFSHGTAGIAAALAQLGKVTGNEIHTQAARDAIAYERGCYVPAEENWPNYQFEGPDGKISCSTSWCHGAPGIGIGRVSTQAFLHDSEITQEISAAGRTTRKFMAHELDYPGKDHMLCHGVFGNLDCLWILDEAQGRTGIHDELKTVASNAIESHGSEAVTKWGETVQWPTGVTNGTYPTLVTGLAGIGYWLLRLHAGNGLPTVLLPARHWNKV